MQVVQETVSLRRVGSRYVGLCPFHSEKTPSFGVNRERGFFHCFGCGVGGNVFKFVELHERLSFPEAVRVRRQEVRRRASRRRTTARNDPRGRRRAREPDHAARGRGEVLSRRAGVGRRPARPRAAGSAGPGPEDRRVAGLRLRAARPRRVALAREAARAWIRSSRYERGSSPIATGGSSDRFWNRLMIPICRESGLVVALRRTGDGGRSGPEVPEQPRDAHLLEGPHALRPERDQDRHPPTGPGDVGRGLLRLRDGAFRAASPPSSPAPAPR